jgi:hypothetical protein
MEQAGIQGVVRAEDNLPMTDLTSESRSFATTEMTQQRLCVARSGPEDGFYASWTPVGAHGADRASFGNLNRNLTTQSQVRQR